MLHTVKEVADALKMNKNTIYIKIRNGLIKTIRVGRSIRITQEELERLTRGE